MADISVKINTPQLDGIIERLDPGARAGLHREIAAEISETVRDHIRAYALTHHATANRLGATRTGNLEDAKVEATSDADGATVTVAALGIRRALGPVEIRTKGKQALTICTISDHIVTGEVTTSEQRQNSFTHMMDVALSLV